MTAPIPLAPLPNRCRENDDYQPSCPEVVTICNKVYYLAARKTQTVEQLDLIRMHNVDLLVLLYRTADPLRRPEIWPSLKRSLRQSIDQLYHEKNRSIVICKLIQEGLYVALNQ